MEEAESDPWNNFVSQARAVGEATAETVLIDDVGDGDYDADMDKDASGWGMMDYIGRNILDSMQSAAGPLPSSDNSYVTSCLCASNASMLRRVSTCISTQTTCPVQTYSSIRLAGFLGLRLIGI